MLTNKRYEYKFVLNYYQIPYIESVIKKSTLFFRKPHDSNIVKNIYFDDMTYQSWTNNIDGLSVREKLRYRWYSDDFNITRQSFFEIKSKKNQIGTKFRIPIDKKINLNLITKYEFLDNFIMDYHLKVLLTKYNQITLINSYYRDYYESQFNNIRITIDKDISFYSQLSKQKFNTKRVNKLQYCVLEVKFPPEKLIDACKILNEIKLTRTRSSKYVTGMNTLYIT